MKRLIIIKLSPAERPCLLILGDVGLKLIYQNSSQWDHRCFCWWRSGEFFPVYLSYKSDFQECKSSKRAGGGFERLQRTACHSPSPLRSWSRESSGLGRPPPGTEGIHTVTHSCSALYQLLCSSSPLSHSHRYQVGHTNKSWFPWKRSKRLLVGEDDKRTRFRCSSRHFTGFVKKICPQLNL